MTSGVIILTSSGFKVPVVGEEIVKRLPKKPRDTWLAHIITASNVSPDTDCVRRDKEAMGQIGFQVSDITLEGKSESELPIF